MGVRGGSDALRYGHPWAKALRKHWKSLAVNEGVPTLLSQFAIDEPAANAFKKHWKSFEVRAG